MGLGKTMMMMVMMMIVNCDNGCGKYSGDHVKSLHNFPRFDGPDLNLDEPTRRVSNSR